MSTVTIDERVQYEGTLSTFGEGIPLKVIARTQIEAENLYALLNGLLCYRLQMIASKGQPSLEAELIEAVPQMTHDQPSWAYNEIVVRPLNGRITEMNFSDRKASDMPILIRNMPSISIMLLLHKKEPMDNGTHLTVYYNPLS